jgi:tetratricopeptide (TPR) repeat protein
MLCLISPEAYGNHFPDPLKNCLNRITAHIYNDQFGPANQVIDSLSAANPSDPLVCLSRAILYQSEMMAEESDRLNGEYFALLDTVAAGADSVLAKGGDTVMGWYLKGQALALKSLRLGRSGHTWAAVKSGLAAGRAFGHGYEIDPSFHDLGLGLGSYRYWKSVKAGLLTLTFILKNEKKDGIELLQKAADSSEISGDAAITSLIWVYINEERYSEALRLADIMNQKYPDGLSFMWALGAIYRGIDDWEAAAGAYEKLRSHFQNEPGNYYNYIETSYYLLFCLRKMNRKDLKRAGMEKEIQSSIRAISFPEEVQKRQKKKLAYLLK